MRNHGLDSGTWVKGNNPKDGGGQRLGVSRAPPLNHPTYSALREGTAEAETRAQRCWTLLSNYPLPAATPSLCTRRTDFAGCRSSCPKANSREEHEPRILEKSSPGGNPNDSMPDEPALGENLKILFDKKVMLVMSGKLFLNFNIKKTGKVLLGRKRCPEALFSGRYPTSKMFA